MSWECIWKKEDSVTKIKLRRKSKSERQLEKERMFVAIGDVRDRAAR